MFSRYLARQLACPSGLVGRWLGRVWNRRNAALNDAAFDALAPEAADRILDVGFGGGYLLERLAGVVAAGTLVGVDASATMVARARRRFATAGGASRVEVHCASAEALPFADGAFGKVCSVNSIFYWQDHDRVFRELARVTAARGRLVLCFTDAGSLRSKRFARHGLKLHEPGELMTALRAAGWTELHVATGRDRHREFHCVTGQRG